MLVWPPDMKLAGVHLAMQASWHRNYWYSLVTARRVRNGERAGLLTAAVNVPDGHVTHSSRYLYLSWQNGTQILRSKYLLRYPVQKQNKVANSSALESPEKLRGRPECESQLRIRITPLSYPSLRARVLRAERTDKAGDPPGADFIVPASTRSALTLCDSHSFVP